MAFKSILRRFRIKPLPTYTPDPDFVYNSKERVLDAKLEMGVGQLLGFGEIRNFGISSKFEADVKKTCFWRRLRNSIVEMKIFMSGASCVQCQRPRIERGFRKIGHKIVDEMDDCDLIYSNNPFYEDILAGLYFQKKKTGDKRKIIFNILDLAPHLGDQFPLEKLKKNLEYCDAVTCISKTVEKDCLERLKIKTFTIYNPIMDVYRDRPVTKVSFDRKFKYLLSGRLLDPNKRAGLAINALRALNVDQNEVAFCGTEYPGFGVNLGVVSEEQLREIYQNVDYVLMTSHHEGLGLQVPEAMAAGAIPVVCNDLSTKWEFLPSEIFPEYDDVYPNTHCIVRFIDKYNKDLKALNKLKEKIYYYYDDNLSYQFSEEGVAKAIEKVYNQLQ